jgi:1-acyl-sn-glycerol-3-phosphate acyltransferase
MRRSTVTDDSRSWALSLCIAVLRPLLVVFTRRDWQGRRHLPAEGGVVLAPNHVSEFDPLAVAHFVVAAGRNPRFLGKAEVFAVPVVGTVLLRAGQIPVVRHTADAAKAFRAAVEAVEAGRCVIVYPEGTLTKDPAGWPMTGKTGAARIALATGAPLIPLAQWGPQQVLRPRSLLPRLFPRKVMHLEAGPPVDLSDLRGRPLTQDVLREATDRLLDAITEMLAGIRGEPAPSERFDLSRRGGGRPATPDEDERAS